ncbi:MAG: alpha/beta fold hydrolase [Bacteroidales bacterium]
MESKILNFNGKTLHYRIEGSGDTVVLLHGFMESANIWEDFGNELARNFLCIAPDLPGHGASDMLAEVHGMELMADAVKAILEENKVKTCVMAGHSMGGYVSLAFAEKYPEFVRGLVLFHSTALADTEEGKRNRERAIEIVRQNKQGYIAQFIPSLFAEFNVERFQPEIQRMVEETLRMPAEAIIAAQAGMKDRKSYLDLLTRASYPVLFIAGKHDSRIPVDKILAQAVLPPHSEVLLLAQAGHMGYLEAFKDTLGALRFFAERAFYWK